MPLARPLPPFRPIRILHLPSAATAESPRRLPKVVGCPIPRSTALVNPVTQAHPRSKWCLRRYLHTLHSPFVPLSSGVCHLSVRAPVDGNPSLALVLEPTCSRVIDLLPELSHLASAQFAIPVFPRPVSTTTCTLPSSSHLALFTVAGVQKSKRNASEESERFLAGGLFPCTRHLSHSRRLSSKLPDASLCLPDAIPGFTR